MSFQKLLKGKLNEPIRDLIFFIVFYLLIWRIVEPCLIFHGGGVIRDFPIFYRGLTFFHPFLLYPGGIIEYVSAFLSQFLYYSWTGAFVLTLHAWLLSVGFDIFIRTTHVQQLRILRFIPSILLLILYSQYTYYFVPCMALLAALFFACFYVRFSSRNSAFNVTLFLVLSFIVYIIAGGVYCLFALLCAIHEWISKRGWRMALLFTFLGFTIPSFVGIIIFGLSLKDAYGKLLPFFWEIKRYHIEGLRTVYLLYLSLPILMIGLGAWKIVRRKKRWNQEPLPDKQTKPDSQRFVVDSKVKLFRNPIVRWMMESCLLLIFAGVAIALSFNGQTKTLFAVDYYAYHKKWAKVVEAIHGTQNNSYIISATDRALYYLHYLGDHIPMWQDPDMLFLAGEKYTKSHWYQSDLYLDLGVVNLAEHHIAESLEFYGERPMLLERMAWIQMAKGNIGTAKIYLGALSKTLLFSKWANEYLKKIESDPELLTDNSIQRLRSMMIDTDYVVYNTALDRPLLSLLEKNKYNHMAFEYLIAWYLLTRNLDKFGENIHRLDDFNYSKIPKLFEEALLIIANIPKKKFDLTEFNISSNTTQRFNNFSQVLSQYQGDMNKALNELKKDYGDSYFYYYIYPKFKR